jgi:hypothetical protein
MFSSDFMIFLVSDISVDVMATLRKTKGLTVFEVTLPLFCSKSPMSSSGKSDGRVNQSFFIP